MRTIRRIIVHHSGSDRDTWPGIVRWHTAPPPHGRGWSAVGYHAGVDQAGVLHLGRPEAVVGAHDGGQNADSLGICLLGDYRGDRWRDVPEAQAEAALACIHDWMRRYGLTPDDVEGHYEHEPASTPTDCPGLDADDIRAAVRQGWRC